MRRLHRNLLAMAAVLLVPGLGMAADCNVAVSGISFGVYDPLLAAPDDSTGSVTVTCTGGPREPHTNISYVVTLGTGSSSSFNPRQMTAGAPRLAYNVFGDAGRSSVLGNATAGTIVLTGTLSVGPGMGNRTRSRTHTVYGRIPALQDAAIGNYNDTLVVTLSF